jgi:IS1 family transposase
MNILSRDKQIEIIAALTEGCSIRAVERLTGVHRDTIMRLGARIGRGCAELHDRRMVGLRVGRLELDELWAYVARKQRRTTINNVAVSGDMYSFIALASSAKAIVAYRTGKRDSFTTEEFVQDLRERVIGAPEISTDGFPLYKRAIAGAFRNSNYGTITKTISVVDLRQSAAHRYSPAEVVAVSREAIQGLPTDICTSYAERQNLSVRMGARRFTRLTNAFSKKLDNHVAAVSLYVVHYNFCRVHETLTPSLRNPVTPAMAIGIADHVWSVGELLDAALAMSTPDPTNQASARRRRFRVIEGGRKN